jgi:hypothetical protein
MGESLRSSTLTCQLHSRIPPAQADGEAANENEAHWSKGLRHRPKTSSPWDVELQSSCNRVTLGSG